MEALATASEAAASYLEQQLASLAVKDTEAAICAQCATPLTHRRQCPCQRCFYCDKDYQNKHWPEHKKEHKRAMAALSQEAEDDDGPAARGPPGRR